VAQVLHAAGRKPSPSSQYALYAICDFFLMFSLVLFDSAPRRKLFFSPTFALSFALLALFCSFPLEIFELPLRRKFAHGFVRLFWPCEHMVVDILGFPDLPVWRNISSASVPPLHPLLVANHLETLPFLLLLEIYKRRFSHNSVPK